MMAALKIEMGGPEADEPFATVAAIVTATVRRGEPGSDDWRLYEQVVLDAALDMPLDPKATRRSWRRSPRCRNDGPLVPAATGLPGRRPHARSVAAAHR